MDNCCRVKVFVRSQESAYPSCSEPDPDAFQYPDPDLSAPLHQCRYTSVIHCHCMILLHWNSLNNWFGQKVSAIPGMAMLWGRKTMIIKISLFLCECVISAVPGIKEQSSSFSSFVSDNRKLLCTAPVFCTQCGAFCTGRKLKWSHEEPATLGCDVKENFRQDIGWSIDSLKIRLAGK